MKTTDLNGCKDSVTILVHVSPCSGVNESSAKGIYFRVFPNPSDGIFNIELNIDKASIVIYDLAGALIYSQEMQAGTHRIDMHDNAKGIYLVRVITAEKQGTYRLMVE